MMHKVVIFQENQIIYTELKVVKNNQLHHRPLLKII
jgi:hypothetical protein